MSEMFSLLQDGLSTKDPHKLQQAESYYQRIVQSDPSNAKAWHILSVIAQTLNQLDRAETCSTHAIRLSPDVAEFYNTHGVTLAIKGSIPQAIGCFRKSVALAPDFLPALDNLGRYLQESDRFLEAEPPLRQVADAQPANYTTIFRLGQTLHALGKLNKALSVLYQVHELQPQLAEPLAEIGRVLAARGQIAEALSIFEQALELKPLSETTHLSLCHLLYGIGAVDRSIECYWNVLNHNPQSARAYVNLALKSPAHLQDSDHSSMTALAADKTVNVKHRAGLHYGKAAIAGRQRDYDQAAFHATQANALLKSDSVKKGYAFDATRHRNYVSDLMSIFCDDHFARTRPFANPSQRPIFIVGMPRSGTSLVEQILASHPDVFGAGELRLIRFSLERLMLNDKTGDLSNALRSIRGQTIRQAAAEHLTRLAELHQTSERVTDKLPENYFHLGWIATLFPQATVLHCRRDPRDIALSCWITRLVEVHWSYDLEDIAINLQQYNRLMCYWKDHLPINVFDVQYENLVNNTEVESRRMVEACGLPWKSECLKFHSTQRTLLTASTGQVRQPIYQGSIGKWKHYEKPLAPILDALEPI